MYKLSPYTQYVTLDASVSGEVVVNCSATGYPDPTYTWQLDGKDINDSCIRVEDDGKVRHCFNVCDATQLLAIIDKHIELQAIHDDY